MPHRCHRVPLLSLLLAGCASPPDLGRPEAPDPRALLALPPPGAVDLTDLPIVVTEDANGVVDCRIEQAALDLAEILSAALDDTHPIQHVPEGAAPPVDVIAVGIDDAFGYTAPLGTASDEAYHLRSHAGGLLILGDTPLGVQNGVWRALEMLGYRQFFPTATWESVPALASGVVNMSTTGWPRYRGRGLSLSAVLPAEEPYRVDACGDRRYLEDDWHVKNLLEGSVITSTGHAWKTMMCADDVSVNGLTLAATFAADTGTLLSTPIGSYCSADFSPPPRLCTGDVTVHALVEAFVNDRLAGNPKLTAASITPQDKIGGWDVGCAGDPSVASDRMVDLAQGVSAGVTGAPDRGVGFLAYGETSAPPTDPNDPLPDNVWVYAAHGYTSLGLTFDDVLSGWDPVVSDEHLGAYLYWSGLPWDRMAPGASFVDDPRGVAELLAQMRTDHAVNLAVGEATYAWGPHGLAYWLAGHAMRNPHTFAGAYSAQLEDFFLHAFDVQVDLGPSFDLATAPGIVRFFHHLVEERPLLAPETVDDLYADLLASWDGTVDVGDAVDQRYLDLFVYVRYLDLLVQYHGAPAAVAPDSDCALPGSGTLTARQALVDQMLAHAYRFRARKMIDARGLVDSPPDKLDTCEYLALDAYYVSGSCTFDRSPFGAACLWPAEDPGIDPLDEAEIAAWTADLDPDPGFAVAPPPEDLVPAPLAPNPPTGGLGGFDYLQGDTVYTVWVDDPTDGVALDVVAGVAAAASSWAVLIDPSGAEAGSVELPPGATSPVICPLPCVPDPIGPPACDCSAGTPPSGAYTLAVQEGKNGTDLATQGTAPLAIVIDDVADLDPVANWTGYFYVPAGTPVVGIYQTGDVQVQYWNGTKWRYFDHDTQTWRDHALPERGHASFAPGWGFRSLATNATEPLAGTVWRFLDCAGDCAPVSVPAVVATRPDELLLPRDVVCADGLNADPAICPP